MGKYPKDDFFESHRQQYIALTYDDVRLSTNYSEILPKDADITTLFSRNVPLKIPLVSAAMDTVTESDMAIAMAKLGGLGIIHKNLSPDEQAKEVARVKLHMNRLIEKPITVYEDREIGEIKNMIAEKRYNFKTFPVLNAENRLVGILTGKDFDLFGDSSKTAKEVMTKEVTTGRSGITLDDAFSLMSKEKITVLPLIDAERHLAGLYVFSDLKRMRETQHGFNLDEAGRLRVGAAIGVYDDAYRRAELLVKKNLDVLVIDTAHGDSKAVIETLRELKKNYPNIDVVAGNISEGYSAKRLLDAGADGIKIGQGPGAICTTRPIAGVGKPQVSAIYECEQATRGEHAVPICADGGLRYSGDVVIALAAGAHSVMMGKMLAATEEAPGELMLIDGRQWKTYRGMGSLEAMMKNKGSRERYGQGDKDKKKLVPEGVSGRVPYKGPVADCINQYVGGLQAGMGYQGTRTIEELRTGAQFFRVTQAGIIESHPHDIVISNDAPNYPSK